MVILCFHGRGPLKALEIRENKAPYGKRRSLQDVVDDLCKPEHKLRQEMEERCGQDMGRHRQR